jgi:hypothetical protein
VDQLPVRPMNVPQTAPPLHPSGSPRRAQHASYAPLERLSSVSGVSAVLLFAGIDCLLGGRDRYAQRCRAVSRHLQPTHIVGPIATADARRAAPTVASWAFGPPGLCGTRLGPKSVTIQDDVTVMMRGVMGAAALVLMCLVHERRMLRII